MSGRAGGTSESNEIMHKVALLRMSKSVSDACVNDLRRDGLTERHRRILVQTAQHEYDRMKRTARELRAYQAAGRLGTYTAAIR